MRTPPTREKWPNASTERGRQHSTMPWAMKMTRTTIATMMSCWNVSPYVWVSVSDTAVEMAFILCQVILLSVMTQHLCRLVVAQKTPQNSQLVFRNSHFLSSRRSEPKSYSKERTGSISFGSKIIFDKNSPNYRKNVSRISPRQKKFRVNSQFSNSINEDFLVGPEHSD